jgi:hypothetical protein
VLPSFTADRALPRADIVPVVAGGRYDPLLGRVIVEPKLRPGGAGSPCLTDQECWWGTICVNDLWAGAYPGDGVCCYPDFVACRRVCRGPCPNPKHVYEKVNCTCQCPNTYPDPCSGPQWVLSQTTCLCECDLTRPCPVVGQTRDPVTCACQCPSGQISCRGVCIDPLTDIGFCGGCPGDTCNPATQLCCNGVCTDLGTATNCSDCGDQVPAGWACCNFTPTQLGTPQNCARCGDVCTGGKQCINGRCQCPSGRIECAGVCCPTTHQGCCNNACTNLNASTAHCGGCNRFCPTGAACVNGVCQCPAGTRPCGGQCWPNAQLCCQNAGCPPASTDCCPGCADFMTVPPGAGWAAWRQTNPGQKWATCPGATFTCNPSLVTIRDSQGRTEACCPPGAPVAIRDAQGRPFVCCPTGSTGYNAQTGTCF